MTTDMMQNQEIAKHNAMPAHAKKGGFLNLFKSDAPTQNRINTQDPNELLRAAYKMLEKAEQDLAVKDAKIKELEKKATVDFLTGLTNRRGFYQAFQKELDRSKRVKGSSGLLMMIDLDDFKTINDKHGHKAGDKALQVVSKFLMDTVRDMDVAARIGGDEFIIMMPAASIGQAMARMQKLERTLNALSFNWDGQLIKIKASIGLQEYGHGDTIDGIIENADHKMYEDKAMKKLAS